MPGYYLPFPVYSFLLLLPFTVSFYLTVWLAVWMHCWFCSFITMGRKKHCECRKTSTTVLEAISAVMGNGRIFTSLIGPWVGFLTVVVIILYN